MRGKVKYYPITQGHIIATWQILYLVAKYEPIHPRNLHDLIANSGKLGGGMPVEHSLKVCCDYGLVSYSNSKLCLTELSKKRIISLCDADDPNHIALRAILGCIIALHNFQWLILYDADPDIFKEYLFEQDPEWVVMLDNAKLFDFNDETTIDWWKSVLSKYEDYKEAQKKAIGDVGEKLTYLHELSRIDEDGHKPANTFVKWASQISDKYGFDVQSIRGQRFLHSYEERDKIQIEVKSSDIANLEAFRFYVSKPEWRTALKNIHSYFFYCWSGVNINQETASDGPFIIPASELVEYMPQDVSSMAEWSECRCVLNVLKYRI